MTDKMTPAVPGGATLRVRVVSRAGNPVVDADVALDNPARATKTNAMGFATVSLTSAEIDALTPAGQVTLRMKKKHHGPLPPPGGKVVPAALVITANVEKQKGFADATPGVVVQKNNPFLNVVLIDAGYNFGASTLGTPARRLSDAEVQRELILYHTTGDFPLLGASEFKFTHDAASGEFDPCDPEKCIIASRTADRVVTVDGRVIAGVKWFYFDNFKLGAPRASDKVPGERFLRDVLITANTSAQRVDQRHAVGLVRLSKMLKSEHGLVAAYTQGFAGTKGLANCHGYGRAVDFAGGSEELPDSSGTTNIRLGVDFVVFFHWGRVPMWEATSVAANPSDPTTWKRQPTFVDDNTDYTKDKSGTKLRLQYRLEPPPFQEPIPPLGSTPEETQLTSELAKIAPHFVAASALFRGVFEFATREYADRNVLVGPIPAGGTPPNESPTPLSAQEGHNLSHPLKYCENRGG